MFELMTILCLMLMNKIFPKKKSNGVQVWKAR